MNEVEIKNENGIRYYYYNIPSMENSIAVGFVLSKGSIYETNKEKGFFHFLEHLLISFDKYHHDTDIRCMGYTNFYYTYFIFETSRNKIEKCINLINLIISGESIIPANVEDIRKDIILEYYTNRDNMSKMEYKILLNDTEYIKHFAIGNLKIVQNCGCKNLKEFHQKYYVNDNINIIFMGKSVTELKRNSVNMSNISIKSIQRKKESIDISIPENKWVYVCGEIRKTHIYFLEKEETSNPLETFRRNLEEDIAFYIIEEIVTKTFSLEYFKIKRFLLSPKEYFVCIEIENLSMVNVGQFQKFVDELKNTGNVKLYKKLFEIYCDSYEAAIDSGIGINIESEMKRCIESLVFQESFLGINSILALGKKIREIDIVAVEKKVKHFLDANSIYKVIYW